MKVLIGFVALIMFVRICSALPLNPTTEWVEELQQRLGQPNLSMPLALGMAEIFNNSLREDCGVDKHTFTRLSSNNNAVMTMGDIRRDVLTEDQIDVIRYLLTRSVCAELYEDVGTPLYHLATMTPRLPPTDICHSVLGNHAMARAIRRGTEGRWWDEWYEPCVLVYLAYHGDNEALHAMIRTYDLHGEDRNQMFLTLHRLGKN